MTLSKEEAIKILSRYDNEHYTPATRQAHRMGAEVLARDVVEMPEGKPGDYLEWDNGAGFRQVYAINAVMICEDCIRYDLGQFAPVVNHPGIVRFLTLEEAEREWKEMCEKLRTEEELTLTATDRERKDNG